MQASDEQLKQAVEKVMDALPSVWGRIRANLRAAAISNFNITLDQFHVLRYIRNGYTTVADLAEKKQVSRPAISQAVSVLVRKGLVTRQTDPQDRRAAHLELTPSASQAMNDNYGHNRDWMKEKMKTLSPDELDCILQAMEILRTTFIPEEKSQF